VAPWTIKAVRTETRNAAARREGLTVGQWLERRVNEWLADGGPVRGEGQPGFGQLVPVSRGHPGPETRADREELRELVAMARELTPPDKDSEALKLARGAERDRLEALEAFVASGTSPHDSRRFACAKLDSRNKTQGRR
jgi:hypothetical protein